MRPFSFCIAITAVIATKRKIADISNSHRGGAPSMLTSFEKQRLKQVLEEKAMEYGVKDEKIIYPSSEDAKKAPGGK